LALPEASRPWLSEHVELREHVVSRFAVVAQDAGGTVFDLGTRVPAGGGSLLSRVTELAGPTASAEAVLDWTDGEIGRELPGFTTFRPPAGARLPYLDDSVCVVVADSSRDRVEAARVATNGVITVEAGSAGMIVCSVEVKRNRAAPERRTLVWSADPDDDALWRGALTEAVADAGAELHLAEISSKGMVGIEGHDVLVVVEPYVLPLPGAIEAAASHATADATAAVAGKILRPDGCLEAAGGTIFFDRSVGLIANGSSDVRAPWHEYVRPVCWAPGLVAASSALWTAIPLSPYKSGRDALREWCSELWSSGHRVTYEPTVTGVRLTGDGGEPSAPLQESAWQRVLDLRPARPTELNDGAWRYLLAHDDVDVCRG
jgi:hypothetical protein